MEACVWRRDNGHRLFAICMGGPTDPEIEVVCFYDYDPATETMTPEASPADTFKPTEEYYNYNLPHKGKDFIILPAFGVKEDEAALKTMQKVYPDKEIHQVNTLEILYGGGNIHCITMQVPTEEENK